MVNTPSSISEIKIPETNIMVVLVDNDGKIFWGIDKQADRIEVLKKMGELYNITFTEEEIAEFSLISRFGVPINVLKQFLALSPENRDRPENAIGIPCDSLDNQFSRWVDLAMRQNKSIKIAIKADKGTLYPSIKKVMNSLQDINQNRYNLITSLEGVADIENL